MQERLRAAERYVCNGVCVKCNLKKFNVYRPVLKQLINSASEWCFMRDYGKFPHNFGEEKQVRK